MQLEARQRNILIIGALIGAVLGAGTAWMMIQTSGHDPTQPKKPIRALEIIKLTARAAGLMRQVDDLRRRL